MPNHYQIVQIGLPILTALGDLTYDLDENLERLIAHLPARDWATLRVGDERDYLRWKEKPFVLLGAEPTELGSSFMSPSMTSDDAPCIAPDGEVAYDDKASSYAPTEAFRTIIEGFNGELPGGGFVPVIGVCDSNSFHNVSYILCCSAFTRAVESFGSCTDYMVLNFDFHNDNSADADFVSSDGWGGQARHWVVRRCHKSYQYTVVGLGGVKVQNLVPEGAEKVFGGVESGPEADIYQSFVMAMEEEAPDYANTCVYISIDRDVLGTQLTQWRTASKITFDELHDALVRCMSHLITRGARIIGFDVTGLPVRGEAAKHSAEALPSAVRADITRLIRTGEQAIEISLNRDVPMRGVRERMTTLLREPAPEAPPSPVEVPAPRLSFKEMLARRSAGVDRRRREREDRARAKRAIIERRREIRESWRLRLPRVSTMALDELEEHVCILLERE